MAAATYDLKEAVGQGREQSSRLVQFRKRISFADNNVGAGESAEFLMLPPRFLVTRCDVIPRVLEGGTLTIDIGDESNPDGLLDGGNANTGVDAIMAKAGTEADAGGRYFDTATGLRVTCVNAADTAVIDVIISGYTVDDKVTAP